MNDFSECPLAYRLVCLTIDPRRSVAYALALALDNQAITIVFDLVDPVGTATAPVGTQVLN
jgi:hypothetical protein